MFAAVEDVCKLFYFEKRCSAKKKKRFLLRSKKKNNSKSTFKRYSLAMTLPSIVVNVIDVFLDLLALKAQSTVEPLP